MPDRKFSGRISMVCFDLGGVLVRICRSWSEGCRAARLDVRGNSAGDQAGNARRELMHRFGTGQLTEQEWAEQTARALGGLYTPEELKRIHDAWTLREYQGALELVETLNARDVATACLSNTNHPHWVRLVHRDGDRALDGEPEYPAVHRLHHHYASHILQLAKPDAAIYQAFLRATGCPSQDILFFDDLEENVAAARALGWNAERIDPGQETVPQARRFLASYGVL